MFVQEVYNWGRYPRQYAEVVPVRDLETLSEKLSSSQPWLARGMGRSYGDTALSSQMLDMLPLKHFLRFDEQTGELEALAGATLDDVLKVFVPKGWFLPVTPGTKYVSLGGALAADVHGKNHHSEGSFSKHVRSFSLLTEKGELLEVSPENVDMFQSTAGGMGLTGIIVKLVLRLKPIETSYIRQESFKARNLDEIFALFEATQHATYSVAWIDCLSQGQALGRSILMTGEHAFSDQVRGLKKTLLASHANPKLVIPVDLPEVALNPFSIKAFNLLYYHKQIADKSTSIVHYDPFFYPLDSILHWNRMYGKRGFTQYQFVIPQEAGLPTMRSILQKIAQSGQGSFLAVLKAFGEQNDLISFPMKGYTLALDFAISNQLFPLLDRLDEMVLDAGGRLYLAKDVRMSADMFHKSYPRSAEWIEILKGLNPNCTFRSVQSDRLKITPW
jgi:decaprenylphospho-beta-D-ribofuranose 2-oxidase